MFQKTSSYFTNQLFYIRNIPIHNNTINKIIFSSNTITTIIIMIIIIFNFSITISLSSSPISSSSSSNPRLPSSSSVSFYISLTSEVLWSPSYLNSSVFFLTTCFLLFIGFRCNILLTKIYIDLLLALVFLKKFSTFNTLYSKFIMCYNFDCRLVLDLYILFQSFRAVLITQKLGSNFKY